MVLVYSGVTGSYHSFFQFPLSIMREFRTIFFFLIAIVACSCQDNGVELLPEGFEIAEGFQLRRVAAEPLIRDPVDLEFNERGDALVLEMPGYPYEDRQSRLLVLKDNDNDGTYDESFVFADSLQLASSIMPYQRGVLVAAPPYLLFVRDEDQNYSPEDIDTLMGGFSTGNLQHNYNGLTMGLDGWIYAANGGNNGKPYWWGDSTTAIDLRGQDFRFNLETLELERLGESSGGFELAMDPYGRIFETHNLEHVSHLVFPDHYIRGRKLMTGHTLENISDHEENGLARIYPIGEQETRVNHPEQSGYFSGACGITYYDGGDFGEAYENTVWVADVVLNLIHVDKISPNGASFQASRMMNKKDFLASTDRSFRPVNMTVGPDGALYVVDMYREVIEHPEWIPDEIEETLSLDAGKDKGRIYRIARTASDTDFDSRQFSSPEELVKALNHPNQWTRHTAHRLLMEKDLSESAIPSLKEYLNNNNTKSYVHALYILDRHDELKENELRGALKSGKPEVQETALKIAEKAHWTESGSWDWVLPLLTHEQPRVRMQAALTLSRMRQEDPDRLKPGNPAWQSILSSAEDAQDEWSIAALTLALADHEAQAFAAICQSERRNPMMLASLAMHSGQDEASSLLVLNSLYETEMPPASERLILQQLGENTTGFTAKNLEPSIRALEQSDTQAYLLPELARLRTRLGLPPAPEFIEFSRFALEKIKDTSLPDSVRLAQLALIELLPYSKKSDILFECLGNKQPLAIQENALRQLAAYPDQPEIGQRVVDMWNNMSPHTRRYASDLLLYIEIHHDALLTGLENGTINIGEMNFDLERRRMLLYWTEDKDIQQRAAALFSDAGVSNRKEAIEKMKPALALEGSVIKGEEVFSNICSTCHVYGSNGIEVGPVLTEINRKSKETLLHDILDPNAAADPKYINHLLETRQGQIHTGIIAAESDASITMRKVGGETITVQKKDVKSFRSLGTSLMMEGLENSLSVQEMADLLEYLQNGT